MRVEVIIKEEAVKDDCYDRIEYDVYGNPYKLTITNGKEFESKSEPCGDAVSRKDTLAPYKELKDDDVISVWLIKKNIEQQPSVRPTNTVSEEVYTQEYLARKDAEQKLYELQRKIGHCKDCKYFEYDSVAKVDGIPLIVAHEICSKWGDGCKTKEDGYCFLFEPKESEEQ